MRVYYLILALPPTLYNLDLVLSLREMSKPGLGIPAPFPICPEGRVAIFLVNHLLVNQAPSPRLPIVEGRFLQALVPSRELEAAALH